MFALFVALMVAVIGFFVALIMPVILLIAGLVRSVLGKPETVQVRQSEVEAIDVESTVLPPEAERQER